MFSRSSPDTQTQTLPEILLEAMMRENIEIEEVIVILASIKNLNIDQLFADGRTPLVVACQCGNLPLVKLLVETYGAKVDKGVHWFIEKDYSWYATPLMLAISDCPDALQIVWYLLDKKANPNPETLGSSPLCVAAEWGHEKIVEALLVRGAHVKGGKFPPCLAAAENNHAAIISLLAKWGADINESYLNASPLLEATYQNHMETVVTLLELGVRIDPQILLFCCNNVESGFEFFNRFLPVFSPKNSIEVSLDIDNCVWPTTLLTHACIARNASLVQPLLKLGANPITLIEDPDDNSISFFKLKVRPILNKALAKQQREQPLLLEAIKNGDREKVLSLLEQGVLANQLTADYNSSPLHLAAAIGNVDIIEILCKFGAKNRADPNDETPLDMAISNGHLPAVICLLKLGAPITKISIQMAARNPEIETTLLGYLKEGKNIPINPRDRYVQVCSLRFLAAKFIREDAFKEAAQQRVLGYLRPQN